MQDLYKPDSNRLRRNLSGIINFAKFREEKLVPYTDMQESVEHLLEDTGNLEELNLKLVCSWTCTFLLRAVTQSQHHFLNVVSKMATHCFPDSQLPSLLTKSCPASAFTLC